MTQEERQQHYLATLAVVVEEFEEVQATLRKVSIRYTSLRMARNGLARLVGKDDLIVGNDSVLFLSTPESRKELLKHY